MAAPHGDLHVAFLGFDGLMKAVAPGATLGDATGRFVDDHHLPFANHILPVADEELPGPHGPLDRLVQREQADRLDRGGPRHRPHEAAAASE